MVARFQSPLPFAWAHVPKQGVVTKKLELAEAAGSSSSFFFQNFTNVALLYVDVIHFCVQLNILGTF